MSERAVITDDFDPLEQARLDAIVNPTTQREHYKEWVAEDGKVDPDAANDFANYLDSRPYVVKSPIESDPDIFVDPKSDKVIFDIDKHFDNKRRDHFNYSSRGKTEGAENSTEELYDIFKSAKKPETQEYVREELRAHYQDMKLSDLAKQWGKAEIDGVDPVAQDIQDILLAKITELSDVNADTEKDFESGMRAEADSNLLNRVLKIKDAYVKEHASKEWKILSPEEIESKEAKPEDTPSKGTRLRDPDPEHSDEPSLREDIDVAGLVNNHRNGVVNGEPSGETHNTDMVLYESPTVTSRFKDARKKLKDLYAGAVLRTKNAFSDRADKAREYFNDEEDGKRRRYVAIGVGAVALFAAGAAAGYAASRGFSSGGPGSTHETVRHHLANSNKAHGSGAAGAHSAHGAHEHKVALPTTADLSKSGDTIWYHAQEQLVKSGDVHPTPFQIYNETQKILDLNHLSWEEARHLPVGYKFKV